MVSVAPSSRLAVLLFTDLVGSTNLKTHLGGQAYAALLARHDELFNKLIADLPLAQVLQDTGDGYFASFATASDAVRFALRFQHHMRCADWGPSALCARIGVHVGEVALVESDGRSSAKVIGLAADLASRVTSLASGGQILLTQSVFNDARQFVSEHPPLDGEAAPLLKWVAHGPYLFKGIEAPMEIFEVGAEGLAPLMPPVDAEKARRVVAHDQEQTLGWRPAIGLVVPQRTGWSLEKKLGEGGFGEVWLARHAKTKQRRVFKFCFDAERLRSFKRELTLFRLLRDALGDRPDIAKLYEVKLDEPPFFLESEYTEGGNLFDWAEKQGGIDTIPLAKRLQIVVQVAEAVGAAHSVGILHKDIKPSNILICMNSDGTIQPRLADFGIGVLAERSRLQAHAITETGFTVVTEEQPSSRTGTRMYAPPETMRNQPYTTQGDVYALGVLLYQLVIADLLRPLAQGWQRDINDEMLRDDISAMVEGDPLRRISSAAGVAKRLRTLEERRAQRDREQHLTAALKRRKRMARMSFAAAIGLLMLIVVGGSLGGLHIRRLKIAQEQTELQRLETQRVMDFLISTFREANPTNTLGHPLSAAQLVDRAKEKLDAAFVDEPTKARLQAEFGNLYHALGNDDEAESLFQKALDTRMAKLGERHPDTLSVLNDFAIVLRYRDLPRAEALAKQAYEHRLEVLGANHPETLESMNVYGVIRMRGRHDDAKLLLLNAYQGRRAVLGADHRDTLSSMNNYASWLRNAKQFEEAERVAREAMNLRASKFGPSDPDTIQSAGSYAAVLEAMGQMEKAEGYYQDAWEAKRKVFGEQHGTTVFALIQYASILHHRGNLNDAEKRAQEAVAACAKAPAALSMRANDCYATVLRSQSRFKEAEKPARVAYDLATGAGKNDPDAKQYVEHYTALLRQQGRDPDPAAPQRAAPPSTQVLNKR